MQGLNKLSNKIQRLVRTNVHIVEIRANIIFKFKIMKYIVYLTTNLVNRKIYVGVHKTENPDIFDGYLGNGLTI